MPRQQKLCDNKREPHLHTLPGQGNPFSMIRIYWRDGNKKFQAYGYYCPVCGKLKLEERWQI